MSEKYIFKNNFIADNLKITDSFPGILSLSGMRSSVLNAVLNDFITQLRICELFILMNSFVLSLIHLDISPEV